MPVGNLGCCAFDLFWTHSPHLSKGETTKQIHFAPLRAFVEVNSSYLQGHGWTPINDSCILSCQNKKKTPQTRHCGVDHLKGELAAHSIRSVTESKLGCVGWNEFYTAKGRKVTFPAAP